MPADSNRGNRVADPLHAIFTPEVVERLRETRTPSPSLLYRLDVLSACGPSPSDPEEAHWLHRLRAKKAAWDTYLSAAFACRLFAGEQGNELRARLTGRDDDNFRSGMAECLACWFLAGRLGLTIGPRPSGRRGPLDMLIELPDGDIAVEVKAPFHETTMEVWHGDESDILKSCVDSANKQFNDDARNLLFLVPELRLSVFDRPRSLIKALYGQEVIAVPIDVRPGGPAGPERLEFKPDGKFLRTGIKDDGSRAFTRVSAVICVEENCKEGKNLINPVWIEHSALVVHNPYASKSVPDDLWGSCVQFAPENGILRWRNDANARHDSRLGDG